VARLEGTGVRQAVWRAGHHSGGQGQSPWWRSGSEAPVKSSDYDENLFLKTVVYLQLMTAT